MSLSCSDGPFHNGRGSSVVAQLTSSGHVPNRNTKCVSCFSRSSRFIFLQYIPDVSRAVFGLLTAMQKRARDTEEENDGEVSKRAKGGGSRSGGATMSSASKVKHDSGILVFQKKPCDLISYAHAYLQPRAGSVRTSAEFLDSRWKKRFHHACTADARQVFCQQLRLHVLRNFMRVFSLITFGASLHVSGYIMRAHQPRSQRSFLLAPPPFAVPVFIFDCEKS